MQTGRRWADQIHSALIEQIIAGELGPGDVLNEQPLAEEFGVSRTPVREALQRLSAAGLAERGARRAFVVRRLDPLAMEALFEAVGELEGLVSRLASFRMTEVERHALVAIVAEGEREDGDYAEANARFHEAIHQGAHSPVLAATLADISLRTLPWRGAQFRARSSRVKSSRIEHRAIMEAILAHEGEEALRLMRAHVAASFLGIMEIVRLSAAR